MSNNAFTRWAPFLPHLRAAGPPDAKLSPKSQIPPGSRGKVPMVFNKATGCWAGQHDWPTTDATPADLIRWATWPNASLCLCSKCFPGVDVDVSHATLAAAIGMAVLMILGPAPKRIRANSPRCLFVFATEPGCCIGKTSIAFTLPGSTEVQAVEILGEKQQYLIEGQHRSGARYEWADGFDPPTMGRENLVPIRPEHVAEFLAEVERLIKEYGGTITERGSPSGSSGSRKAIGDPSLLATDMEELAAAVRAIPCEEISDYGDFISLCAAMKAASGGSEEFYADVYLPWALEWPGADADEIRGRWDSFHDAALGVDYVFGVARDHDWIGGHGFDAVEDEPASGKAEEDGAGAAPSSWIAQFVYVSGLDRYYDLTTGDLLTESAFKRINSAYGHPADARNNAAMVFQMSRFARKVPSLTYRPGAGPFVNEFGRELANSWRPGPIQPRRGVTNDDVRIWLDHVAYIVPDPVQREHLLDTLAHRVQKPNAKLNQAVLVEGAQRIGKNLVFQPFKIYLGSHNYTGITAQEIEGQFTGWLFQKQLVSIEEIKQLTKDNLNKLKFVIAAPPTELSINMKGVKPFDVPNIVFLIAFTNSPDALPLDRDDQRWFIISSPAVKKEQSYYKKLGDWIEANTDVVIGWLADRDISLFDPYAPAPETEAKREMRDAARDPVTAWIETAIEEKAPPFDTDLIVVRDVMARIPREAAMFRPKERNLVDVLRGRGARRFERVSLKTVLSTTGSDRAIIWAVRELDKVPKTVPEESLRKIFWAQYREAENIRTGLAPETTTSEKTGNSFYDFSTGEVLKK